MTPVLRIELIVLALLAIIYVVHKINKRKLLLKYSLVWLLIALIVIIVACFPLIAFKITSLVKIVTPSNFVFLIAIMSLFGISVSLTEIVSTQAEKTKRLVQIMSIDHYEWKGNDDDDTKEN